jgi:hypothetical protein
MKINYCQLFFPDAIPQDAMPDQNFYIGWDSEYDSTEKLVCSQFYLKNVFISDIENTPTTPDLIAVRNVQSFGTVLIFNDQNLLPGIPFCEAFSTRLLYVQTLIAPIVFQKMILCTFYSNAEISALFPTLNDMRNLKIAQNDTVVTKFHRFSKNNHNLSCIDILGTVRLSNYKYKLPFSVDVIDARHIYSQTDLKGLGSNLKINKLTGIDFSIKKASEWLQDSEQLFLDYSAIDAVIPLEAILNMHSCKNKLFTRLSELNIVPTLDKPSSKRFLQKRFTTTAGIADSLIYSVIEKQEIKTDFVNLQKWENDKLPFQATKTKGGLNKVFIKTPTLLRNVDQFDISGAYATAMREFKLPLSEPQVVGSYFTLLKDLAGLLDHDNTEYAIFNLVFELPEDSDEWERPLVIFNYTDNVGFTGSKTDRNQWFTIYEILTLALMWPDIQIEVIQGYVWNKDRTENYLDLQDLYLQLKSLRKEYKSLGEEGDAMQNTIKLIGNAGYGKTLQNKNVLNPQHVDTSILANRTIDRDLHSMSSKSKIYSSLWGNAITSMVRSVIAITAWKNKAYMAVTDSLVCDTGTFIPSKMIETCFNKLNLILKKIEWECDYTNVNFLIIKERDYFSFSVKDNIDPSILDTIDKGLGDESIVDKLNVLKAAKRGFKSIFKDKKMKNIDFAKKSIKRILGTPIDFTEKTLIKYNEFLFNGKTLNEEKVTNKQLGSDNIRYLCNSIEDLQKRIRIKNKCRSKGYADGLDCKMQNKNLYDKISINTKAYERQPNIRLPQHVKIAIFQLLDLKYSLRYIESFLRRISLNISKSTLHRWYKKYADSSIQFIEGVKMNKNKRVSLIDLESCNRLREEHPVKIIYSHANKQKPVTTLNTSWGY